MRQRGLMFNDVTLLLSVTTVRRAQRRMFLLLCCQPHVNCFRSIPDIMSTSRYCEPCSCFLRGEIVITFQTKSSVTFEHHRDFQSFDTALRLPCAICSLAWTYAKSPPSMDDWAELLGAYSFGSLERDLKFYSEGHDRPHVSDFLLLEPWQGTSISSVVKQS
jgi:hypothetical protein